MIIVFLILLVFLRLWLLLRPLLQMFLAETFLMRKMERIRNSSYRITSHKFDFDLLKICKFSVSFRQRLTMHNAKVSNARIIETQAFCSGILRLFVQGYSGYSSFLFCWKLNIFSCCFQNPAK